jgi:hypothetical protein
MVGDDAAWLAAAEATTALQQHVSDKMATLQAAEKKAADAHAHVRAIALLLKEEQASAAALEAEAMAAALQLVSITASSSAPPPPPSGGDIAVIATLHA